MSRTVHALYDTKAEAEAARDRLQSEFDVEGRAKIIDKSAMSESGGSDFQNVNLSEDDQNLYGEGLRRGGFMLCAKVDEDEEAERIVTVLKQTSSVDLNERQINWRNDGWAGAAGSGDARGRENGLPDSGNLVEDEQGRDTTFRT